MNFSCIQKLRSLYVLLMFPLLFFVEANVFAGDVILSWDPPTTNEDGTALIDLAGYRVYYGTSSGFYSESVNVGNVISYKVLDLIDGVTYYFATTAYDTSGNESEYSEQVSLTVGVDAIGSPIVLISPMATILAQTPTYTWEAIPEIDEYRLYVANFTDPNMPLISDWYTTADANCSSGVGQCSITPDLVLPDAEYIWWARGRNGVRQGPWSSSMTFKVLTMSTVTGQATLVAPTEQISNPTPVLTWNAISGATHYRLFLADQTDVNVPVLNQWFTATETGCSSGTGTCSITSSVTLPDAAYYWWIRAKNVAGLGPWSAYGTFTVITATTVPDGPALITPSGIITNPPPTYTWDAVSNATSYHLYVTNSVNNVLLTKWYTAEEAGCASGTGTCTITPAITPLADAEYFWWVRAKNVAGNGPWSAYMPFTKK